jgi:ACR3 family arsenite efflux pump ArsB
MIFPMMLQIDWRTVKNVGQKPQGLLLTLVALINRWAPSKGVQTEA